MKYCEKCGASLSDEAAFCSSCGTPTAKKATNENAAEVPKASDAKIFPFNGENICITAELDLYNMYRLEFRELAFDCVNQLKMVYNKQIHDLDTFLENFLPLYNAKLNIVLQKANDILLSKNIWNATIDSIRVEHQKKFYSTKNLYSQIEKAVEETLQHSKETRSKAASYLPRFVGHGKGLSGVLASAATGFVMNAAKDGIKKELVNTAKVSPAQKQAIYASINLSELMTDVFMDYWHVHLTLVNIFSRNGHRVWLPNESSSQNARNIFANMSNPNFPKERIPAVLEDIIKTDPYNKAYYSFAAEYFGETEELEAIRDYFGYRDMNNPLVI